MLVGPTISAEDHEKIVQHLLANGFRNRAAAEAAIVKGAVIVGVPIGERAFIEKTLADKVAETRRICDDLLKLARMADCLSTCKDILYRIHTVLKLSVNARCTHLSRTISTDIFIKPAREHDNIIYETAMQLYGVGNSEYGIESVVARRLRARLFMPARDGGNGFTSLADNARAQFLSTAAQIAPFIALAMPDVALGPAPPEPAGAGTTSGAGAARASTASAAGGDGASAGGVGRGAGGDMGPDAGAGAAAVRTVAADSRTAGGGGAEEPGITNVASAATPAAAQAASRSNVLRFLSAARKTLKEMRIRPFRFERIFPGITQLEADAVAEKVLDEGALKLDQLHWNSKRGLHKLMMARFHAIVYQHMRRTWTTTRDLAAYDSTGGPGSIWVHAMPPAVRSRFKLNNFLPSDATFFNPAFQLAYRSRLGLPIVALPTPNARCKVCDAVLDVHGDHAYACLKVRGPYVYNNHNRIRDILYKALSHTFANVLKEPKMIAMQFKIRPGGPPPALDTRPDLAFNSTSSCIGDTGNTHIIDVSGTNATAISQTSAVERVVFSPDVAVMEPVSGGVPIGAAAARRDQEKTDHYKRSWMIEQRMIHPFVLEAGGRFSPQAVSLMQQIVLMQFDQKVMNYWNFRGKSEAERKAAREQSRETMQRAQKGGYGVMFRRLMEKIAFSNQIHRASLFIAYQRECVYGEMSLATQLSGYSLRRRQPGGGR